MRQRMHQRGFTLLEMSFATVLLGLVMATIYQFTDQAMSGLTVTSSKLQLEDLGRKALNRISKDLRQSGLVDHPSYPGDKTRAYPYIWTGNAPVAPYASHQLDTGELPIDTIDAENPNDGAIGDSDGIVFLVPITTMDSLLDDAGVPLPLKDAGDGTVEVIWGGRIAKEDAADPTNYYATDGVTSNEISYVLTRDPAGDSNVLLRRESATGKSTPVCRFVERIEFKYYLHGNVQRQSQIHVKIYLRRKNNRGDWVMAEVSAIVAMRSLRIN